MPLHHRGLDNLYLDASAITIGSFDGVHLGHQHIIRQLKTCADALSIPVAVITFFPHPVIVLRDIQNPFYLTLPDERAAELFRLGVDHVVTLPFTRAISNLSAFEFMEWICSHLHPKHLTIGEDFALGKDRKGGTESLREIGSALGYELEIVSFMEDERDRISSSRIRTLLAEGEIRAAAALLGRLYAVPVQISSNLAEPQLGGLSLLKISCNPMQLLPGDGLYESELEAAPGVRFPVFIHRNENQTLPEMTGVWMNDTAGSSLETGSTRLTFISRLNSIPAEILKLPLQSTLISQIHAIVRGE